MTSNTGPDKSPPATPDAASNALAREQAVDPQEVPVKQRNPEDKGVNPTQKGPAQPGRNGN